MKSRVARALAKRICDGEIIGIGSGSTVELAVEQIGLRVKNEGLKLTAVTTSLRSALVADRVGIRVLSGLSDITVTWAFDGADEVADGLDVIKGQGCALLSEKILARRAKKLVIIVSADKVSRKLGEKSPLPVEIVPEALGIVDLGLRKLGAREIKVRNAAGGKWGVVMTEHGNIILDVWFDDIRPELEAQIKLITGVVENGLFVGCADEILIAREDGIWSRKLASGKAVETRVQE